MNDNQPNSTVREFDVALAIETAGLVIRTASRMSAPDRFGRDFIASIVQMVGAGLLDPKADNALDCGGYAAEVEGERLRDAVGDDAIAALSPDQDILEVSGAYPVMTGNNLVIMGTALPLAWDEEAKRQPQAIAVRAFLDGRLEDGCFSAAAAILGTRTAA